jgi:large subunit ribosomal protein L10
VPNAEKIGKVQELAARFRDANGAMFTDFRGLTVKDATEVRRLLRGADTSFMVSKNTLTRIAAREAGLEGVVALLEGPTAIAFLEGDAIAGAKALLDAGRRFPALQVKGSLIDGQVLDEERSKALASLEPREVSVAKVAGMLTAPLARTAFLLRAPLQRLAYALAERGRQPA